MISGDKSNDIQLAVRKGTQADIPALKRLADQHKQELGFIIQGALKTSIDKSELFVATCDEIICGFVQYRHRKDVQTTLYNIVVAEEWRGQGVGRKLICALVDEASAHRKQIISLKCPVDLSANNFYPKCGFILAGTESGKFRALNIWKRYLDSKAICINPY